MPKIGENPSTTPIRPEKRNHRFFQATADEVGEGEREKLVRFAQDLVSQHGWWYGVSFTPVPALAMEAIPERLRAKLLQTWHHELIKGTARIWGDRQKAWAEARSKLDRQLNEWLQAVGPDNSEEPHTPTSYPIGGCKAVIAPHAGYAYSGPAAAWAYRCIDVQHIKRIFILGPSHHVALPGCALSQCDEYATPLGPLKLDKKTIAELAATGKFERMDQQTDEEEHSIEMHLPYVRKIFEGRSDITLIPILVGSLSFTSEKIYGTLLEPYLRSADTLFVISSDFCHWGTRFGYTYFIPRHDLGVGEGHALTRGSSLGTGEGCCSIDQSIERVDREGMRIITFDQNGKEEGGRTPRSAHEEFNAYLKQTRNTICGRHPIGVLLGAMTSWAEREVEAEEGLEGVGGECRLVWTRYEQSERVKDLRGSSVSYASAFVGLSE